MKAKSSSSSLSKHLSSRSGAHHLSPFIDSDGKVVDGGFSVAEIQRSVMRDAERNSEMRKLLNEGTRVIGVYHAQLGLDGLRQSDQLAETKRELEDLTQQERHLQTRLQFLFYDCQRLTRDNSEIRSRFPAKDAQIAETKRLLGIEGEKFEEATVACSGVQQEILRQSKTLVNLKDELRNKKRQHLVTRQVEWDADDDVGRLEEAMSILREEMAYLEMRMKGAASTKAVQPKANNTCAASVKRLSTLSPQQTSLGVSMRQQISAPGGLEQRVSSNGHRALATSMSFTSTSTRSFAEDAGATITKAAEVCGPGGCRRVDCIAVAQRISQLEELYGLADS